MGLFELDFFKFFEFLLCSLYIYMELRKEYGCFVGGVKARGTECGWMQSAVRFVVLGTIN